MKTDLLDYVLENGFHVARYLKQKALLSIDDSASQKGKGKGRSAAAKEVNRLTGNSANVPE